MEVLKRLTSDSDDEEEYETTETESSRDLVIEFQRVTVEFRFVRGGVDTLEYDEFEGRLNRGAGWVKSIEEGIHRTKRAGMPVEKLCKVDDAHPVRKGGHGNTLKVYGREAHEVVPANVARRTVKERTDMQVVVPVTEKTVVREDTGEVIRRSTPRREGETEITEVAEE